MSKKSNLSPAFQLIKAAEEEKFENALPEFLADSKANPNLNSNFTPFELKQALQCKRNSTPGRTAYFMKCWKKKKLPDCSKSELLGVMNNSWERGEVPADWKIALIILLKKPLMVKMDPQSYRPIYLTSCICKTMETLIAKRLTSHLEKHSTLSKNQSGFSPGRSTTDQCTRLESGINLAFMERKVVEAATLDLEKAFDLMWSMDTIRKRKEYGINGKILRWIHNFLTGRKIQVRVGDDISELHNLENSCPMVASSAPSSLI